MITEPTVILGIDFQRFKTHATFVRFASRRETFARRSLVKAEFTARQFFESSLK